MSDEKRKDFQTEQRVAIAHKRHPGREASEPHIKIKMSKKNPRITVGEARKRKLAAEAKKRKLNISEVAEEKFRKAEGK